MLPCTCLLVCPELSLLVCTPVPTPLLNKIKCWCCGLHGMPNCPGNALATPASCIQSCPDCCVPEAGLTAAHCHAMQVVCPASDGLPAPLPTGDQLSGLSAEHEC